MDNGDINDTQPNKSQPPYHQQRVCPWWCCFTFDNIFRKILQDPERILKPFIKRGWTVLDVGPGMGYFTIPLAKLVGDTGRVIAADLQQRMLDGIHHRAIRAGVRDRITLHQSTPHSIGISESIDFCLAFWMVHEVPDRTRFFGEISSKLKPDGLLLLVEPKLHVSKENFEKTLGMAKSAGLSTANQPKIFLSYSVLLKN
jgi:ubiquinone/menaquinone biosynthesis C-methylase UbiE